MVLIIIDAELDNRMGGNNLMGAGLVNTGDIIGVFSSVAFDGNLKDLYTKRDKFCLLVSIVK